MNFHSIYHKPSSNYCFAINKQTLVLRLRVSNKDIFSSIKVIYEGKYVFYSKQKEAIMNKKYEDQLFSYYEIKMCLEDVRFAYVFLLSIDDKNYYYSEDGITETYDFKNAHYNCFQYAYINDIDIHKEISWLKNSVFYEIFVDRFNQGDFTKKSDYINTKWGDKILSNSFAGGDLQGIIDKLDYLSNLGINTLYLTPIFSSVSNHKYDINNYYKIDSEFGDEKVFKELVNKAHAKNMYIVIDGVFNHTSDLLEEFIDVTQKGRDSKYFDWFIIKGEYVDKKKVNYETFSNCYYHPKFNTSNLEVEKFLINIGKYYVSEYDIDGWRLDVSDEASHVFWRNFRREIKSIKSECFLVGENWHDANPYLGGDQFDSIMNYSFTKVLIDYFAYEKYDAYDASCRLNNLLVRNTIQVNNMMLNLIDSHDTDRFYTLVKKDKDKLLSSLALTFMYKGVPCLYYGIEIPLEGGYDPDNRKCFPWDKLDENSPYFQKLIEIIKLKKINELEDSDIFIYSIDNLLYVERYTEKIKYKLLINQSKKSSLFKDRGLNIISHKTNNFQIEANGFIIIKEEL
ncbi:MAG: glycoside hydrolase family 13 protein [Acholeplasmatales bacterium]|jgi:glycosidase|nr:glycoside hydrolase family 13 protein [Acholeplasmatales bacterium]